MLSSAVGKLVRVPLREVWPHEAYDFTIWLQENIEVLGETLDLNFENVEREQAIGSFDIDLVGKIQSGGTVVIENQLEKSNHDHLGKLITYSVGMGANAAIWIVSDPRPEHVAAVTWLNESNSANFYMVKVEAVRIGESPPAPLLTLIVGPSEETKDVGQAKKDIAERYSLRRHWWTSLITRSATKTKLHAHIPPESHLSYRQVQAFLAYLSFIPLHNRVAALSCTSTEEKAPTRRTRNYLINSLRPAIKSIKSSAPRSTGSLWKGNGPVAFVT